MSVDPQTDRPQGLFASLRRLLDNLLGLVQVRLELLSTDIAEERFNLVRVVVLTLGVLFCFQAGVILAVLFFVLSVPGSDRLAAIGIAALVLLVLSLAGGVWLWRWLKTRPPLFAATIAEFKKDRERFGGKE